MILAKILFPHMREKCQSVNPVHTRSKTYESNVIDSERPAHTYTQFNVFNFKGKYKQTSAKNLRKSSSFTFQQHYIDTKANKTLRHVYRESSGELVSAIIEHRPSVKSESLDRWKSFSNGDEKEVENPDFCFSTSFCFSPPPSWRNVRRTINV